MEKMKAWKIDEYCSL